MAVQDVWTSFKVLNSFHFSPSFLTSTSLPPSFSMHSIAPNAIKKDNGADNSAGATARVVKWYRQFIIVD